MRETMSFHAVHPGKILKEELLSHGLSAAALSGASGRAEERSVFRHFGPIPPRPPAAAAGMAEGARAFPPYACGGAGH
jgi:hypothetical protein